MITTPEHFQSIQSNRITSDPIRNRSIQLRSRNFSLVVLNRLGMCSWLRPSSVPKRSELVLDEEGWGIGQEAVLTNLATVLRTSHYHRLPTVLAVHR